MCLVFICGQEGQNELDLDLVRRFGRLHLLTVTLIRTSSGSLGDTRVQ